MACFRTLMVLFALLIAVASTAAAAETRERDAADLRRLTQARLDAIAPGDAAVWERTLDERFIHMDESGVVRDKPALLKELQPLPPGLIGRIEIDKFKTRFHGDTAVTAYEMQEYLDYHGQPLSSRFRAVDTWLRTPQGWRLIAEHTAAVLKDPPVVTLPRRQLCEYVGKYALTDKIMTTIRCENGSLVSEREERSSVRYAAELRDVFFVPGQPRTRRIFQRDSDGKIAGFVDRREGEDILWKRVVGDRSPIGREPSISETPARPSTQ